MVNGEGLSVTVQEQSAVLLYEHLKIGRYLRFNFPARVGLTPREKNPTDHWSRKRTICETVLIYLDQVELFGLQNRIDQKSSDRSL